MDHKKMMQILPVIEAECLSNLNLFVDLATLYYYYAVIIFIISCKVNLTVVRKKLIFIV